MSSTRRDILRMASGLAASTVATSMSTFAALAAGSGGSEGVPAFLSGHFRPAEPEILR